MYKIFGCKMYIAFFEKIQWGNVRKCMVHDSWGRRSGEFREGKAAKAIVGAERSVESDEKPKQEGVATADRGHVSRRIWRQ